MQLNHFLNKMQNVNQFGLDLSSAFDSETGVDVRPRTVFASQELEDPFEDALPRLEKPRFPNLQTYYHREYWIEWGVWRESQYAGDGVWCGPPEPKWHAVSGPERTGAHVLKELFECESFPLAVLKYIITFFPIFELRLFHSQAQRIKRTNALILDERDIEYGRRWDRSRRYFQANIPLAPRNSFFYNNFKAYEYEGNYCIRCGEHDMWRSMAVNGACRECRHLGKALDRADDRADMPMGYWESVTGVKWRPKGWGCVVPGQITLELLLVE